MAGAASGDFCAVAFGLERLKTEDWAGGDAIVCLGGATFCTAGVVKSNRSPNAELAFVGCGAADCPGAESNAPKPVEELNVRDTCDGAGAAFGFESKNPPPLSGGEEI
jgi:hypothetical protein